MASETEHPSLISIAPLLKHIQKVEKHIVAESIVDEISSALSLIFQNRLSVPQCSVLLFYLHYSGLGRHPLILSRCAESMRDAAAQIDRKALREITRRRGRQEGSYKGGLCDIVGTGGDGHSTFNISTTASILASSLLLISKHGNRASSSTSGSADLLQAIKPKAPQILSVTSSSLPAIYEKSNYAFLFAPTFHPGMKHVAPIRKDLGFPTVFNLLGPLANPVEGMIEARVVGVAQKDLGPIFAESLRLTGARRALVVCGAEDLDEISCAGKTHCWKLVERPNPKFRGSKNEEDEDYTTSDDEAPPRNIVNIEEFQLRPLDFGFPEHALSEVSSGKLPGENAETLMRLLRNELSKDDPVLHFVLINTAALFAISGVCDADTSSMGHGDDGKVIPETGPGNMRWKEGVRRARWTVESGTALKSLEAFIEVSHGFKE